MRSQHFLYLQRGYLVTSGLDNINRTPPQNAPVAVFNNGYVTGPKPTVAERLPGRLRPAPILDEYVLPFDLNLSGFSPPSPVLEKPPSLFIAIASVS